MIPALQAATETTASEMTRGMLWGAAVLIVAQGLLVVCAVLWYRRTGGKS